MNDVLYCAALLVRKQYDKKTAYRLEKEQETGKKLKGSVPKAPVPGLTGKDQMGMEQHKLILNMEKQLQKGRLHSRLNPAGQ